MKIAIPIKTNKENSTVAPLFGKAKWFAFVEDGKINIEKNESQGGANVVEWLLRYGVSSLIIQKMSNPPYQIITKDERITIFYAGDERIELNELIKKYESDELTIVDDTNASDIIKEHHRQHQNR
jgi:predicted Fe-Mo cluster-binding NifX family protein